MRIKWLFFWVVDFALVHLVTVFGGALVRVYILGDSDDKWGGLWGNVQIGFYVYGWLTVLPSAVALTVFLLLLAKPLSRTPVRESILFGAVAGLAGGLIAVSPLLHWLSSRANLLAVASIPGLAGAVASGLGALAWRSRFVG